MEKSAKERILEAGIELFAGKGYAAVGVREIAAKADVNLSMISYYYNGKVGILKSIINDFFDGYISIIKEKIFENNLGENTLKHIIPALITYVRDNKSLALIVITELPLDSTDVTQLKAEKIMQLKMIVEKSFLNLGFPESHPEIFGIMGPAFISTITSHFLFSPVISRVFNSEFDDKFYEQYKSVITNFILGGIENVKSNLKDK